VTDIDYVWVCTDCAMWWANAELPEDDPNLDDATNAQRIAEIRDGTPVIVDCGECSDECLGFSTRRCDSCQDHRGGVRHRAVLDIDRTTLQTPFTPDKMAAMKQEEPT
jgi:bacterioferritin-associated ferredoxin